MAYFGPAATFTQEALLTQPDLAAADLRPLASITAVLEAVARGEVDLGFVPIENAIEGTVSATIDGLILDVDLHIQREVVMDIHLHLMAGPGTALGRHPRGVVVSRTPWPSARSSWPRPCPAPSSGRPTPPPTRPGCSGESDARPTAPPSPPAWRPSATASIILAEDVEDHPENQTRFVARGPAPGARRRPGTTRPASCASSGPTTPAACTGSSGQFAARNINLTKLESRPTKQGLGDYCFVIDLSGHIGDEVVADCLRDLHASLAGVKFLGLVPGRRRARRPSSAARPMRRGRRPTTWLGGLRARLSSDRRAGPAPVRAYAGGGATTASAASAGQRGGPEGDEHARRHRPVPLRHRGHGRSADADARAPCPERRPG